MAGGTVLLNWLPYILLIVVFVELGRTYLRLRYIPGPFLAKFTNIYRLFSVWTRHAETHSVTLHKRYGDIVRIGPNCVSICRPDMIPSIYGIGKGFVKSDFYSVWQNVVNGKRVASMVFTTDEQQHAKMKRPVAPAYSLSTLVEFEPLIDSTIAVFLTRLDDLFAETGKVCDFGQWLQWFAFDVIGELTFSKRLGFLDQAKDVDGIIASVSANFDRCSVLGQMPWLDLVTYKNPLYLKFFAKPIASPILAFGQKLWNERREEGSSGESESQQTKINDPALREKVLHGNLPSKPDFLSRFMSLHETQPDIVTDRQMLAYLFMNINAGSDTISSSSRAIFYYLLKHRDTYTRLAIELDEAKASQQLSAPLPTWTQCEALPYLGAVIKEALRLHPALGLPMERVVPADGLQINDAAHTFLPAGTVVGINPWVLQRDKRIFGPDAEVWRPDRWLDKDAEKVKYMDHHFLSFGAGKRTCLGRNIAMLELYKLVPALLLRYEMRLAEPEKEWQTVNSWIVRQEGLNVLLSPHI